MSWAGTPFICPKCGIDSVGNTTAENGIRGRACDNGHFWSYHELKVFRETGKLPLPRRPRKAAAPALKVLRQLGVGARTEQLSIALQWMLQSYDTLMAAMPVGSQAHALAVGAFGVKPDLAREVLGA